MLEPCRFSVKDQQDIVAGGGTWIGGGQSSPAVGSGAAVTTAVASLVSVSALMAGETVKLTENMTVVRPASARRRRPCTALAVAEAMFDSLKAEATRIH